MPEDFSKSLLAFVVKNIDSVELLDVLALLRSNQEKEWQPEELDSQIRSSLSSIKNRLEYLCELGIASKSQDEPIFYRYRPQNEELRSLCEELIMLYQTKRTSITEMIYTKSFREIFSFAEAFRVRKGDRDG